MNPKKQKAKDRRRARVLAEQAWEAANHGNLDLAEKIIRRAVSTQEDNPVLWNDQGVILGLRHKDSEAAKSFAAALSLAPTFADPYAHLATLRLRQGQVEEALGLQTQAVKYAPQNASYAEQLLRFSRTKKVAPPGSRARPRRCGAVLHSRPSRSHGWRRRIAAGQAWRRPNHGGHTVRARRAVP
jgi:Flp pilus assembly protein TadD